MSDIQFYCDECGHLADKIQYSENPNYPEVGGVNSSALQPAYRHKLPHPRCNCRRFNMTADQVTENKEDAAMG